MVITRIINDNLERCNLCNLCKESCTIIFGSGKEIDSPRSKAIKEKLAIVDDIYYKCSLCGACTTSCPMSIDFDIIKKREKLVARGVETEPNKVMIENIRKYGNPFGDYK
ncbi:(Fe-S)-binding protein [Candidatus Woesearchaeota archaeon]|nr:(Fe-S)-binding protein [Candidatus Woesearchaeota archaeon]